MAAMERLSFRYIRHLSRSNYIASATVALFFIFCVLWMLFRPGGDATTAALSGGAYTLAAFVGAGWALQGAYRGSEGPLRLAKRHRLAWLCIGMGLLLSGIGSAGTLYLQSLGLHPFPSLADIGSLLLYPLVILGMFLLPSALPWRGRIALDALFTTLCLLGVGWFFLIGPIYFLHLRGAISFSQLLHPFMILLNFCLDFALIFALVQLLLRHTDRAVRPSLVALGAGILARLWADGGYAFLSLCTMSYHPGAPLVDPFWIISFLLLGLAAPYHYSQLARRAYDTSVRDADEELPGAGGQNLRNWLVYVPLTLLLALTVFGETWHDDAIAHVLVIFTALIGILGTVRYLLATSENETLLYERERQHEVSERLRHVATQLHQTFEREDLLALAVRIATMALGFDVAIVAAVEDQAHPLYPYSPLLINASTTGGDEGQWRVRGAQFLYRAVVAQQEVEMEWSKHILDTSPEVHDWQQAQRLQCMHFFPLRCQGKPLGCIGFARRGVNTLSAPQRARARAYTEQVASALERVDLYQEAREQEAFARAMAAIATRLNAAVVEPAEIYQLICREAANALRADYALLYTPDCNGNLAPLAVHVTDSEQNWMLTHPRHWPMIHPYEYEASALSSLQPVLVRISNDATTKPTSSNGASERRLLRAAPSRPLPALGEYRFLRTLREQMTLCFVESVILAPLISRGEAVGLLVLGRALSPDVRDPGSLDISDLPAVQDFVEQAAVAFTNAQLYQHLQMAHERLQELDRLKDQFMITASHELRTPLTAVQGYIELLAQYDDDLQSGQRQEFLQKARRSCEELVVMLGNVMDASRLEIEAGIKPALIEPVEVREMLHSVIDLIEPQMTQEQREVRMQVPSNLRVCADPPRMRQVLMNISVNALKYSPSGSPILFAAQSLWAGAPQLSSVVITIKDWGKGIGPEDQQRLFQRFVRLEEDVNSPVRGSGLGLYISRRLVEAMGGKIWIESNGIPGEGSAFHIQLPMAP